MARLLVRFAKRGSLRFISHLDTVEVIKRGMRRAGLPVAWSKGNSPQARLSILHPLPVGTESLCEYCNVELERPVSPERFRDALEREMPPGIEIRAVRRVARKFNFPLLEYTYRVTPNAGDLPDVGRIGTFLAQERIPRVRVRKGRREEEDLRPYLREIRRNDDHLIVRVASVEGRSPRPEDVLQLLLGREEIVPCRVLKLETAYGDR